jgi:transcriptional regulator with XRE-family HTH domain
MNDTTTYEHLGKWVAARRKLLGMRTQPELAAAMTEIGPELVSDGYISNMEAGRIRLPGQPFLRQLAQALRVSEIDVLRASGVLSPEQVEPEGPTNTFPVDDPRWQITEALLENDPFVIRACLAIIQHARGDAPMPSPTRTPSTSQRL